MRCFAADHNRHTLQPWDDETDLKAMEESVRAIEKDGLVWGLSKVRFWRCCVPRLIMMLIPLFFSFD